MSASRRLVVIAAATILLATVPAASVAASTTLNLDGSFSIALINPDFSGLCPGGGGDECGVIQMTGLGAADWVYVFGPTFTPNGTRGCFDVDGTFSLTLQSDGSAISGPLTGVFCRPGESAQQRGTPSYGNPFSEIDTIALAEGNGQFEGLAGSATFSTSDAGARFRGHLTGTLAG